MKREVKSTAVSCLSLSEEEDHCGFQRELGLSAIRQRLRDDKFPLNLLSSRKLGNLIGLPFH
jgi:hypothetical protein